MFEGADMLPLSRAFKEEALAYFRRELKLMKAEEKGCGECKDIRRSLPKKSLLPRICRYHQNERRQLAFQD